MNCGRCSLCCTLCSVVDINKPHDVACEHCADVCSIYEKRPQGCRDFKCAYVQMKVVNIAMRPDNCGVVFEKMSDTKVLGMIDPERDKYPHVKGQIEAFKKAGYEVIMTLNGKVTWQ